MKIHYNIKVSGKVQKVGFRYNAYVTAIRNNVAGFVRNEDDGSVYIEAEGNDDDVEYFLKWCQHGPQSAIVEKVDVRKAPLLHFPEFTIKH